ncbi:hypothetical protein MXM51_21605 [Pantoea stewartii]|uniref:hypothetical protein n=1 Tax=Pantoea stewartii TaxID=66269 RepID=UPI002DBAAC94|nr:hypothetical protein [Pantoea stewartii]MEB6537107.1 hypothetical protein [Pantoea stewartii]
MKNSKDEMLCDTLIGEAALALLEENGCITFTGVLEKLDSVKKFSVSEDKIRAAGMAISEIKADMAARSSAESSGDENSVRAPQDTDKTSQG